MAVTEISLHPPDSWNAHPNNQELKPTQLWQKTGAVEPGTLGPGCAVGCIYCNQIAMDTVDGEKNAPYLSGMVDGGLSINTRSYIGSDLEKYITVDNLLAELKKWPLYTPESPVILENFNDPGNDWLATAELATRLTTEQNHRAAISFITKMGIKPHEIIALQNAQAAGARLIGIVTYTNMPTAIESSSSKVRLSTIQRLKEAGIPVIVSMRPMIKGINDSRENIDTVLQQVAPYADTIIVGGLFVFEEFTLDAFEQAGYPLDESYSDQIYSPAKVMKGQYKEIVRERAEELEIPAIVHNHTSCAISHIMTDHYKTPTSDRFTHWISPKGLEFDDDCAHCPEEQKQHCAVDAAQTVEAVIEKAQEVLTRLGYADTKLSQSLDVPNTILIQDSILTFEEIASIKEGCRWYVDNLPDARGMHQRTVQALTEDMSEDVSSLLAGMTLIGQEWHIFVRRGSRSSAEVDLIQKWIRSRSRHRAHIMTVEILEAQFETVSQLLIQKSHGLQSEDAITHELKRLLV
ncbi:MAG: hypothetical protein WDZ94_05520 [Patescibacteria group bacterium]